MKNIVRAFVLVLTLSGSAAYTKLTLSTPSRTTVNGVAAQTHMVPTCEPDDPNACGLKKK